MSAKDKLKAVVVSDVLSSLPENPDQAAVADAIEAPLNRIMDVVVKRVDKAEKAARSHKAEVDIQQQQVQRLDQILRTRMKQLTRAQDQVASLVGDLEELIDQLEGKSLPDLAEEVRGILARAETQGEDTPPAEVQP